MNLKKDLIKYLKTKSPEDIEWVKKDKSIIFEKHNELKEEDAHLLFDEFIKIKKSRKNTSFQ